MKKVLSIILTLCLIFIGATFAGCGNEGINIPATLVGKPEQAAVVIGNGGLVVQKGEYIYFASGFVESSKLGTSFSNTNGSITNGGLYRAKIEQTTNIVDEIVDVETAIIDPELMISKIVGFKDGGLYIFKDRIYFSSPSIARDSTGTRYDLITFYSCNLDGSDFKEFYQTKTWVKDTSHFTMTMIEERVYLLISHKTEVLKIDEKGYELTLVSDCIGATLPKRETILHSDDNPNINEQFVYYTKDTETDGPIALGQTLYKINIVTGKETELFKDSENKIKLNILEIRDDRIFYTRTSKYSDVLAYYSNSLSGSTFLSSEAQHTYNAFTTPKSLGNKEGSPLGITFIDSSKLYMKDLYSIDNPIQLVSSASSILGVYDGYVYYISGSDIYRVDSTNSSPKSETVSGDLTPLKTFCDWNMDFCFFLATDSDAASGYSMYALTFKGLAEKTSTPQKLVGLAK